MDDQALHSALVLQAYTRQEYLVLDVSAVAGVKLELVAGAGTGRSINGLVKSEVLFTCSW
jgi:hypothetical protein